MIMLSAGGWIRIPRRSTLERKGKILFVGGAAADPAPKPKFKDGAEPISWHLWGDKDHVLPVVCLEKAIPLVACCWTEEHRQGLKLKVMKALWAMFLGEKSSQHQPALRLPHLFG